ncbi:ligase [Flavobacterium noncentrifugens]|uniref:O-antigen ligase like membrane protein n=1 Tax=Flavobacterium noncentrifugens TaxID=1128970 RepID=A0A1G8VAY7_9FLAO|nr:O-antigen ligase family protein [Flavobacterium noncentrifugens]GEP50417.1 ligase [Flavobacterium noncentrifugens]SDJ63119.1 O-antigen ligase like membrane protein [Flavobacterium noncentrifugens]
MQASDKNYLYLILGHIVLGAALFYFPLLAKVYGFAIIIFGVYYIFITENKKNEVLYATAYMVGSEIILRMTNGNPLYEFSKYGVILYILMGIYYSGISKHGLSYWIFLLLLIPGVMIALSVIDRTGDLRKEISFAISGPLCLGICSLFTYTREVTFKQINTTLLCVALPIVSCTVFLILYSPTVRDVLTGTGSSSETSGGFGPNQVSTALGLAIFIFVSRLLFNSKTKLTLAVNLILVAVIGFRGLVTFSRGGILTSVFMIIILLYFTYSKVGNSAKNKINYLILFLGMTLVAVWIYSQNQTDGLLNKRYSNQDAAGREKSSQFTGREEIAAQEIDLFLENPIFGAGAGRSVQLRLEKHGGERVLSHSEITRMLSEHGALGIIGLMILLFTPIILKLDNSHNIYLFCFVVFWLFTINHAAMRMALPAYIYSLSLLKVVMNEEPEPAVHRE